MPGPLARLPCNLFPHSCLQSRSALVGTSSCANGCKSAVWDSGKGQQALDLRLVCHKRSFISDRTYPSGNDSTLWPTIVYSLSFLVNDFSNSM